MLTPPLAVPPESCNVTVQSDTPDAFAAGVNERTPALVIAGWLEKIAVALHERLKLSVCDDSFAGPAESEVAHDIE